MRRFHVPTLDLDEIELGGTEAHHLLHVLRGRVGDEVELFDGLGASAPAIITATNRRTVELKRSGTAVRQVALVRSLTLAVAPPKGDRLEWLVEKATELGVSRIVPLLTQRGTVDPRETKLDRLRATIISACKQCGRNLLMELAPPTSFADVLASLPPHGESGATSTVWIGALGGAVVGTLPCPSTNLTILIGPEGGWTDEELATAHAVGVRKVQLGDHVLRTETAAIAFAAWVAGQPT